ncbi:MAG: TIGR00341 family protein [Fimbriimonadaceae bacterium]|nr:TIGR00341 family protein [Fimbriimonadaceae bacterium]
MANGAVTESKGESGLGPHTLLRLDITRNAATTVPFITMNALAAVVASYGLLAGSSAVVIGAMIIATLLGPITGLALALVDGNNKLLRRALAAEAVGVAVVLSISILIGTIHQALPLTAEILSRTKPNVLDLVIALAGGAAGAYATVSPRLSVGLVGVAISTALVPPLATCGICLARGDTRLAVGGFVLFLTNLVAIQVASSAVMWLHGLHQITSKRENRQSYLVRNGVSGVFLLILFVVLSVNFVNTIAAQRYQAEIRDELNRSLDELPGVYLAELRIASHADITTITAVIRSPYSFDPATVKSMQDRLAKLSDQKIELHVRAVLIKETTSEGYLHEITPPATEEPEPTQPVTSPTTSIDNPVIGPISPP